MVVLHAVDGEGNHFDLAFAELAAQPCSPAQLRGADGCVVSGVGEQDSPPTIRRTSEAVLWASSRFQSDTTFLSLKQGQTPLNAVVAGADGAIVFLTHLCYI